MRLSSGTLRNRLPIALAGLAGLLGGILLAGGKSPTTVRADDAKADHGRPPAGAKAPIQEILHCPLSFAGVHLLKELPEYSQVAYHYCKPVNAEVNQCVLYDGTGPDARLIGIEYLVSDAIYQKMPPEEKVYWHDHKHEVDAGLLKSLTQSGDDEEKTMQAVRPLWGKVFHTWTSGKTYPIGPPKLFWSATGEEPFVVAPDSSSRPSWRRGGRVSGASRRAGARGFRIEFTNRRIRRHDMARGGLADVDPRPAKLQSGLLPASGLGPDGKLKFETEQERRDRLELARVRLREIADIPDDAADPPDEVWMRAIDEMRPHRPVFKGCY